MNESKSLLPAKEQVMKIDLHRALVCLLFTMAFCVFMQRSLELVLGPIMAVLIAYLYFVGYAEIMTALVIVANDAMGTIFLGSISFPYLLLVLTIIRLTLKRRRMTGTELLFLSVALVLQLQLWIVELIALRNVIYSMTFILSLFVLPRDFDTADRLARGFLATMAIIAVHACITGGVEYTEFEAVELFEPENVTRYGILGAGTGDPNLSSFLINMGLICAWTEQRLRLRWKILLSALFFVVLGITVSISGLLAMLLIAILGVLISTPKKKGIVILAIALLLVVCLASLYLALPVHMRLPAFEGYIIRIEEAFDMIGSGDIAGATTNRSSILANYLDYIMNQPFIRFLFGGNSLRVAGRGMPHNTYIGFVLQVGIIASLFLFAWMLWRVWRSFKLPRDTAYRKRAILWKVLSLFMAFTLSFYEGSLWALWMYFVILL